MSRPLPHWTVAAPLAALIAMLLAMCGAPPPSPDASVPTDPALLATLAALPTVPPPTVAMPTPPGVAPTPPPTVAMPTPPGVAPTPPPTVAMPTPPGVAPTPPPTVGTGAEPTSPAPDGRLGEAVTRHGVTVQATLRDLGGAAPVWALDLAVRVEAPPVLHWRLATAADAAAGRAGGDVVGAALIDAAGSARMLTAHGDAMLDPMVRGLLHADCPPSPDIAPWDRGVGPYPRRLPPGATARAWLVLTDPSMALTEAQRRGLRLALHLPGRAPITLALADSPSAPPPPLAPLPPNGMGAMDASLPGGVRLLDAAITPPDGDAPCPGARRVRATIGNPTAAPVPPPTLIVSIDGYRYPLPAPDETPLAPGDQRTITAFLAPLPPDAVDAPAMLLALAPQRADDAPTPWMAVPIPPASALLPDG